MFDPDLWPLKTEPPSELEVYVAVQEMRLKAEEYRHYGRRCLFGEKVFYVAYHRALAPGHIYSPSGMEEIRISSCCEFHFDYMFPEEDNE